MFQLIFIFAALIIVFIVTDHLRKVWGKPGKNSWELLISEEKEEKTRKKA
ncbi:hypothetical protein [Metabacillus sp. RGM 3146]